MKVIGVIPGKKESAHIIDVDKPEISSSEVRVKVLRVGICGTDHEIDQGLYGEAPEGEDFLILGHESLGIVEETGRDVKGFEKGDMVVSTVRRPCPENCLNCRSGENDMCLTGNFKERGIKSLHGFMAEYYKEIPEYLVKIPEELSDVGVLLEPLSIVEKAIMQTFKIQERMKWKPKTALVLGAGPIGLLATFVLRDMGINTYTLALDSIDSKKARLVMESGASYIDSTKEPIPELGEKLGNIDFILEATGSSTVSFQAMDILGINGVLALTGITGGDKKLEVDADRLNLSLVLGNKLIFGSVNANITYFRKGVKHMQNFEVKWPGLLSKLISRKVAFEDFKEALLRKKDDIKVIIEIGK
ncbi:L-threonine 3-dehydrogenase [archaeon]|nr:L-threonine 3-dehydrogenase [archaeon]